MRFDFTEKEKDIIRAFEHEAKANGITAADFIKNIADIEEPDENNLIIKYDDLKNTKLENLSKKFEEIGKKIDNDHLKKLKTQAAIIEDAKENAKIALVFLYKYYTSRLVIYGKKPEEVSEVLISTREYGYKQLFKDIILYGANIIFELIEAPVKEDDTFLLFDHAGSFKTLKNSVLSGNYAKINSTSGEQKLNNAINDILSNSQFIKHDQNVIDDYHNRIKYQVREFKFDNNHDVVMANILISNGINTLSANESKLLRLAITQSKKGDTELYEYEISAKEIASILDLDIKNLYKNLDKMTDHIQQAFTKINDDQNHRFFKLSWVDRCEYNNGIVNIKLAEGLKPYILGLKRCFSKIKIEEYLSYKSKHTTPIRELLEVKMGSEKPHADVVIEIPITVEELKRVTNTAKDYKSISLFRSYVLDVAINEINDYPFGYHVTATPYKNGKSIEGYNFIIESQTHYNIYHKQEKADISAKPEKRKRKPKEKEQAQQLTLKEFFDQEF